MLVISFPEELGIKLTRQGLVQNPHFWYKNTDESVYGYHSCIGNRGLNGCVFVESKNGGK